MWHRIRRDRCSDDCLRKPSGANDRNALASLLQPLRLGLLAANVSLRVHPALAGAIVGLLISLPDAFALKSYAGILGTGLIFGAIAGWPPAPGEPRFVAESLYPHYELSSRAKRGISVFVHSGDTVAPARTLIPRFARDDNRI